MNNPYSSVADTGFQVELTYGKKPMPDTYTQCPKCGYKPPAPLPESEPCPSCGIYIDKWRETRHATAPMKAQEESYPMENEGFISSLMQPMEKMDTASFYGRCIALLLIACWSWYLVGYDYRYAEINGSFMHNILLPIHEAGHVIFSLFGEFLTILGGSFFQLALPFGISIAFVWVNRDNFGASVGLWWTGVSLIDLSPYIYDALHPQMILLGGSTGEDGPHDWIYLLTAIGQLRNAQLWGAFAHFIGSMVVIAALVWASVLLWRQRGQLGDR